jgi:peptidoglycan/xylan/chitin deacetylase (PgdA/CDA1 family)
MTPQVTVTSPLLVAARRVCRHRSVILGGHGVADVPAAYDPENLCVAPDRFRAQVELMLAAGFEFVTVAELTERMNGGAPPPGLAALSFDDGMDNNLSVLLPLLREYGIPATVYVTTGLIGRPNPWLDPRARARMMTADELRELTASGVEIGGHSVTHPDLSLLDAEACRREVRDSRDTLVDVTGGPVTTFAYPYCGFGPTAQAAVREAGFSAAVTGEGRGSWERFAIDRAMVTGVDGLPAFLAKLSGLYEPVYRSSAGAAARAATRRPRRLARSLRERRRRASA